MRRTQCQDWLAQVNTLTDTQRVEVLEAGCAEDDPEAAVAKLDLDKERRCPYDRKFYLTLLRFGGGSVSLFFVAICSVVFFSQPVFADSNGKSQQRTLCGVYDNIYESANKNMASIFSEGIIDDSAPRETNRQLRILNERMLQIIVLFQMQAHGCAIQKMPSIIAGYVLQAAKCQTEMSKGNFDSPKCDRDSWENNWKNPEDSQ